MTALECPSFPTPTPIRSAFLARLGKRVLALALTLAAVLAGPAFADAQVRFVNLSDRDVFVAQAIYQSGRSNSGDLQVVVPEGFYFEGFWKVEPGGVFTGPAAYYYVEQQGGAKVTWQNLPVGNGPVHQAGFKFFLNSDGRAAKEAELVRNGHRIVEYQMFGDGFYTIAGTAFTFREQVFTFDYSSRDYKTHFGNFDVPGRVVGLTVDAHARNARAPSWSFEGSRARLNVGTVGSDGGINGRNQGYYRGSVTVAFIVRR